jgi:hypothetical protein
MKRNFTNIGVVLAIVISLAAFAQGALAQDGKVSIAAPSMVSYQGYVTVNGSPYNGTGYFKFAIVDGGNSYWSNDGSSLNRSEPSGSVQLTVTNGLLHVLLGDLGLGGGMTQPLSETAFNGTDRRLRIWFSTTGAVSSFTQLAPDRRIASVPFALVAERAASADSLQGAIASDFQLAIKDGCPYGYAIGFVESDGSARCEPVNSRPVFTINTLVSAGAPGRYVSATIGVDGLPLISYYDGEINTLSVAHCNDLSCSSAVITTLEPSGVVGLYNSIVIGVDGFGLIAYYDGNNGDLKVAHCQDLRCQTFQLYTLVSGGNVGWYTSLAIGSDGLGVISYYDVIDGNLEVAHCSNVACSSVSTTYSLDLTDDVGSYTSIAIGSDGYPLITYWDTTHQRLKVAHCTAVDCSSVTLTQLDPTILAGAGSSVTIGSDGFGLIAYWDQSNTNLKVIHCTNLHCSTMGTSTLDSAGDVGSNPSITIGPDGLGLISYYDNGNGDLKLLHCSDLACSTGTITLLDSVDNVGLVSSITIGVDGLALIAYYDSTNGALKVAHLSNTLGTPWVRRR